MQSSRSEPLPESAAGLGAEAVRRLAQTVTRVAESASLEQRLSAIVETAAAELQAEVAVARALDPESGDLVARAVACSSPALAAELEGSRFPVEDLELAIITDQERLPEAVRRAAERSSARAVLQSPINVGGRLLGSVELLRAGAPFSPTEQLLGLLAASHIGLVLSAFGSDDAPRAGRSENGVLELAGEALAAGAEIGQVAHSVVRLAAEATGAQLASLWRAQDGELSLAVHWPAERALPDGAFRHAERALEEQRPFVVARDVPTGEHVLVALQLGEPPLGVLQLGFEPGTEPVRDELMHLATFAVRAANALRASEEGARQATELEHTRAVLSVLDEAIAQLSLTHTLETAVDRVAELVGCERVAVYLLEGRNLTLAARRGLLHEHLAVAGRLLELALGPFRARGMVVIEDAAWDLRLSGVQDAEAEAEIEAAVGIPLLVHEELIGLLVAYLSRGRALTPSETGLLAALAVQLGVAVQNARLHEQAKTLGADLEDALKAEKETARQLRALSEISGSLMESRDFDATLQALARTAVQALRVDAAVVRVPDKRGEMLVKQAFAAADERMAGALESALSHPVPVAALRFESPAERPPPIRLDAASASELGAGHDVLVPFLERGSTAAVVPIASPQELLATLTIVSIDVERPISDEALETALPLANQAALALDKARLSQQQRQFFDTMQRSLLPQSVPETPGIEIGHVYEASARLDIGGDVYDLMTLPDGRLAAVVGDVTGHGIDAAADMAMVKFLFRSLAREHSRPGDFLSRANEVVVGEIAPGKFVTMAYLIIDLERALVACAAAGHPSPRLVLRDGAVRTLRAGGLALGVEGGQAYDELEEPFPRGAAVVLYTDGVVEARQAGEIFGDERLDALLARCTGLGADELARAILDECRGFAGGELDDDVAIVVVKRNA